jgi:hypothetical protein
MIDYLPDGTRIIISHHLPPVEDWSDVRSPSRAKRRLKRGFKQRIKFSENPNVFSHPGMPGTVVMAPGTYHKMMRRIRVMADEMSARFDANFMRALGG